MPGLVVAVAGGCGAGDPDMFEANGGLQVLGCEGPPGSHARVGITAMPTPMDWGIFRIFRFLISCFISMPMVMGSMSRTRAVVLCSWMAIVASQLSKPLTENSAMTPNKFQALSPLKAEQIIL